MEISGRRFGQETSKNTEGCSKNWVTATAAAPQTVESIGRVESVMEVKSLI